MKMRYLGGSLFILMCYVSPVFGQPGIYWVDDIVDKIQTASADDPEIKDIITSRLARPSGIALDPDNQKMYWTDRYKVQRANFDGSDIQDLVAGTPDTPTGLELDLANGRMYWTDYGEGEILRAGMDGSQVEVLISGLEGPVGLALDTDGNAMYWVDQVSDKIRRSRLDGTQIEDLVTSGVDGLREIDLDPGQGKMYWADFVTDKIQRANLDGSQVEDIISDALNPNGIELDPENGKIYWADRVEDHIARANLDGSEQEVLFADIPGAVSLDLDLTPSATVKEMFENGEPDDFALIQNYPNPFNPETTIRYYMAQAAVLSLKIYNLKGRLVRTLVNRYTFQPGSIKYNGMARMSPGRNCRAVCTCCI